MTSDLVAAPVDVSSPFGGLLVIESGADLAEAIGNGDWAMGVLAGAGFALDAVATVIDPLGSVIAMGIGWVLEHVEPLKSWFNELTGDAGEVAGFAQTWANIGTHLQTAGQELLNSLNEVQHLTGETMNAYRQLHTDAANHVIAAGGWSNGISGGMQAASTIVQIVHEVTRDALSEVVGTAISAAIETACTFGLATPLAISQVTTKVSALAAKVGRYVDDLISSIRKLSAHLDELMALIEKAADAFQSAVRGGSGGMIPATAGGPNLPSTTSMPSTSSAPGRVPSSTASGGPNTPNASTAPEVASTSGGPAGATSQSSPDSSSTPKGSDAPDASHADGPDGTATTSQPDVSDVPRTSPSELDASEVAERIRNGEMTVDEVKKLPPEIKQHDELAGIDRGDGRDAMGRYTGEDSIAAGKEQQGLADVAKQYDVEVISDQVLVKIDGIEHGRRYDGLIEAGDGKYIGVEIKSGDAINKYTPTSNQHIFDSTVSPDNPARGKLNGKPIEIIGVILKEVK